jgi:hypothetical protein
MIIVLLLSLRVHQFVVQINYCEYIKEISKDIICHMLEDRWGSSKSKWHYCVLEVTIAPTKSCVTLIARANTNLIVSSP